MASPTASRRLGQLLASPWTWVAAVTLVLVHLGFVRWFAASVGVQALSALLASALLWLWCALLLGSGYLQARRSTALSRRLDSREDRLASLRAELAAAGEHRAVAQLDGFRRKATALEDLLGRRLDTGELLFSRTVAAAEAVAGRGEDNAREIGIALSAAAGISLVTAARRSRGRSPWGSGLTTAKNERLCIEQRDRIEALLAENDALLQALDAAIAAIADARARNRADALDADAATRALSRLTALTRKHA